MVYPLVSVVMPTCKRAHFLKRAIDSVLNQTYGNVEVIVVDDNADDIESRNSTVETLKEYESNESIKYVLPDRKLGGGLARNAGINVASGEYIAFLDDDDAFEEPKIEAQLKFMMMHNLDFSFTDLRLYDCTGTKFIEQKSRPYIKKWDPEYLLKMLIIHSYAGTPSFMVKKEALLNFGGFRDIPMGQDFMLMWDFLEYAIKTGARVGYFPSSYIKIYLHSEKRISLGQNKIDGENRLYKLKCTKKNILSKKECRFVDFRHYSVLAVTCKRSKRYTDAFKYFMIAFNTSPIDMMKESLSIVRSRITANKTMK